MLNIDKLRSLSIFLNMTLSLLTLVSCAESTKLPPSLSTPAISSPTQTLSTPTPKPLTSTPTVEVVLVNTQTQKPAESGKPEVTATPYLNTTSIPDPGEISWQIIVEGLEQPTSLVSANDGSGRLFIVEKPGLVRIFRDGQMLQEPFIDLRDRVRTQGYTTAGLLGMTFHPEFSQNGFFYANYTASNGATVISRFKASPDLSVGDPDSELVLLEIPQPVGEHRGGDLAFGPDGYLYASIGDGGGPGYGDPDGNAQNTGSLLGKILRLDLDNAQPYAIPPDNPFTSGEGHPEVWALGLRNAWRFSFDSITGDLYIADVGENAWEEVNFLPVGTPGGANFGWNYFEGFDPFQELAGRNQSSTDQIFINPVVQYDHTQGCSITGGMVYRGQTLPEWNGVYIYGDYCQGNIWGLLKLPDGSWENQFLVKLPAYISTFGIDEAGEIYLADITGKIFRMMRK
jgi:glucose/arabinose dehydrogenase